MNNIQTIINNIKGSREAENLDNDNVNANDTGNVKEDKEQKLRSELSVMRIRQDKEDFGYHKHNMRHINKTYKSVMDFIFNGTFCCLPRWVVLLLVLALTYIFGNIDKELIDNNYLLIIQSILRTSSEALVVFFIFLLAIPSAKGIRRLFSRFTDKIL